eukprot:CAMPEP_0183370826 /NCGR_PEP_ID=MMETSP0164_2-20130417/103547_1 /TAXON_ID=221442 /ORGANISM="Coccolithus pelagicus ssp braarudi, Strain PLY182g" /LENGTH=42 /DNA_ID= /DNA_START= /DNA_END= /DNA_ORIENTATION=
MAAVHFIGSWGVGQNHVGTKLVTSVQLLQLAKKAERKDQCMG